MSGLMDAARDLVEEARDLDDPKTFLRAAVSDMSREDVETLSVAYLLAQIAKPRKAKPQPPRERFEPTPEMLENRRLRVT